MMWAVPGYALRFLAPARSRDGALPNSDMGGSEPFVDKMIQLMQRAYLIKSNSYTKKLTGFVLGAPPHVQIR